MTWLSIFKLGNAKRSQSTTLESTRYEGGCLQMNYNLHQSSICRLLLADDGPVSGSGDSPASAYLRTKYLIIPRCHLQPAHEDRSGLCKMAVSLRPALRSRTTEDLKSPDLAVPTHEPSQPIKSSIESETADSNFYQSPVPEYNSEANSPTQGPTAERKPPNSIQGHSLRTETGLGITSEGLFATGIKATASPELHAPSLAHCQDDYIIPAYDTWTLRPLFPPSCRFTTLREPLRISGNYARSQPRPTTIHTEHHATQESEAQHARWVASVTPDSDSSLTSSAGSTPLTSANSRTSTCTDTLRFILPVDSSSIYCWSAESKTYIGKIKDIPVPEPLEMEWVNVVRVQLLEDLHRVTQSLPRSLPKQKTTIMPELCMVGEAKSPTDFVELKPTVWIRCGSRRCKKAVSEAVKDLRYLHVFSKGRVHVHRRAPRLASSPQTATTKTVQFSATATPSATPTKKSWSAFHNTGELIGVLAGAIIPSILIIWVLWVLCSRKLRRMKIDAAITQTALERQSRMSELESQHATKPLKPYIKGPYGPNKKKNPFSPLYGLSPREISEIASTIPQIDIRGYFEPEAREARINTTRDTTRALGLPSIPGLIGQTRLPIHLQPTAPGMIDVQITMSSRLSMIGSNMKFTRTRDGIVDERVSTMGGCITVDDRVYGLTTAHAVADLLYTEDNELSSLSDSDSASNSEISFGTISSSGLNAHLTEQRRNTASIVP